MNRSNVFGASQGFQGQNNSNQGLFQSFNQQDTNTSTSNTGFGQRPTFGQPSAFSPASVFNNQGSGQVSGGFSQTPSFGPAGGLGQSSVFSSASAPTFGQPVSSQPGPVFGPSQHHVFGNVQKPVFGFGQTSGFGNQLPPGSINAGASQPSFGQASFGQVSAFSPSSSAEKDQTDTQTVGSKVPAKSRSDPFFKPIFSPGSVSSDSQSTFGLIKPVTSMSDSTGPGKPRTSNTIGFSFSQPGATPSSFGNVGVSQTGNVGNAPQFIFSQPANPSSNMTATAAAQSTTVPNTSFIFSQNAPPAQPEPKKVSSGGPSQPLFSFKSLKPDESTERVEESSDGATGTFGKSTKRKEEADEPNIISQRKSGKASEVSGRTDGSRHPPKRPLVRSRELGGGLFRNALSGLIKESSLVAKKERPQEHQEDSTGPDVETSVTPPRPSAPVRHFLENVEKEKPGEFSCWWSFGFIFFITLDLNMINWFWMNKLNRV